MVITVLPETYNKLSLKPSATYQKYYHMAFTRLRCRHDHLIKPRSSIRINITFMGLALHFLSTVILYPLLTLESNHFYKDHFQKRHLGVALCIPILSSYMVPMERTTFTDYISQTIAPFHNVFL